VVKTDTFLNGKIQSFYMITALDQKKFIDWFVDHIFEKTNEFPRVYSKESPQLKDRLRLLCYKGLRGAVSDFFTQTRTMHPFDLVEHFDYFLYHNTIEQRVKEQLMNDSEIKPYLSSERPETIFERSHFEGECGNIAILAATHYLDRLSLLADEFESKNRK